MQVNNFAECSAILSTFISLSFVFKTFFVHFLDLPLKTGLLYFVHFRVPHIKLEQLRVLLFQTIIS